MDGARALLSIVKREAEQDFLSNLERLDIHTLFSFPGEGTAGQNVLSLLGLEDTEKTVLVSVTSRKRAQHALMSMVTDLGINLPGHGIALCLPVSSIGGARFMRYLMGENDAPTDEVNSMDHNTDQKHIYPYELIMVISRRGTSDIIMEAARSAGAGGGTVVHAKGTAPSSTSRFFGISIADEKELILIATRHEKKDCIMHAIMEKAGAGTEAQAVVFTLPVEDVVGLRSIMDNHENP